MTFYDVFERTHRSDKGKGPYNDKKSEGVAVSQFRFHLIIGMFQFQLIDNLIYASRLSNNYAFRFQVFSVWVNDGKSRTIN